MRPLALIVGLLFPLALSAQEKKDPKAPPPIEEIKLDRKEPVSFEKDIEPILANKCMYCHSGNVTEGKFDMSTHDKFMKGGAKRGVPIVAGKSAESTLYKMAARKMDPIMPPKKEEPLTPEELALIKLWIDQGAKAPQGPRERPKVIVGLPSPLVKPIRGVAISPDKSIVATGRGNQIHVYDALKGEHKKTLLDPSLKLPDGKPVQAAHISLVESMVFSPDGKTLATGSYQEVTLWDVEKSAPRQKLTGFAERVVTLAYSPDGKYLVTGGGAPTEDGEIKVFTAADGKPAFEIKNGHSDTVFGVAFSPDNTKLATCGADKFVKVWEVPSGKFIKAFEGHTHHVLDVGWKPDGKGLVSCGADNVLKVWDYEKGEQTRTVPNAHSKQVTRLVFIGKTPTFLTASGDASVKLWNQDGNAQRTYAGATDYVYAVAASPDGKVVAAGGEEGVVRLYNGDNAQLIKALLPPGEEPKKEEPKKK